MEYLCATQVWILGHPSYWRAEIDLLIRCLKSLKSNVRKYSLFVFSVVRRFFCIYLEISDADKATPTSWICPFWKKNKHWLWYNITGWNRCSNYWGHFFVHSFIKHQKWISRSAPAEKYLFKNPHICFPSNARTSCQVSNTQK